MRRASTGSRTSRRPTPRTWRDGWRARKASSAASRSGGACAVALRVSAESRTRRSCSSFAIAATATCPPACFPRARIARGAHRFVHADARRASRRSSAFDIETECRGRRVGIRRRRRHGSPPRHRCDVDDAAVLDWFAQKRRAATRQRFRAALPAAGRRHRVRAARCGWNPRLVDRRRRPTPSPSSSAASSTASRSYTPQLVSWNGGGFDLPVLQSSRAHPRRRCGALLGLGRRRPRLQVQQLPRPLSTRGIST